MLGVRGLALVGHRSFSEPFAFLQHEEVFAKQQWGRSGGQYSGPGTLAGEVAKAHSQEYQPKHMFCPKLRPENSGTTWEALSGWIHLPNTLNFVISSAKKISGKRPGTISGNIRRNFGHSMVSAIGNEKPLYSVLYSAKHISGKRRGRISGTPRFFAGKFSGTLPGTCSGTFSGTTWAYLYVCSKVVSQ